MMKMKAKRYGEKMKVKEVEKKEERGKKRRRKT